ncbi:hypothetical protein Tco_0405351 [Tanacetum coccineum]
MGNGIRTSFWNDLWIGESILKLSFPRLYALEDNKDSSVADKINDSITSSFRRFVRGGVESFQLDHLKNALNVDEFFLLKGDKAYSMVKSVPIKGRGILLTYYSFCSAAKEVIIICRWWDLDYQLVESYEEWFAWFKSIRLDAKSKDVLEGVFFVSWWSVWFYRNQLLFADASPRKSSIFDDITLLLIIGVL